MLAVRAPCVILHGGSQCSDKEGRREGPSQMRVSASKRYSLCIVETSLFNAGFLGRLAQLFLFKISHVSGLHLEGLWS